MRWLFALAILASGPYRADAQRQQPSGVVAERRQDAVPSFISSTDSDQSPRWPFVVVGAIVGGTAAGLWYASLTGSDGWGGGPVAYGVVIAGGSIGGALLGFVVGQTVRVIRR
jgi:hypothetical protein